VADASAVGAGGVAVADAEGTAGAVDAAGAGFDDSPRSQLTASDSPAATPNSVTHRIDSFRKRIGIRRDTIAGSS
jgi:hypothetical protein